jgi:hypothetical protein
MPLNLTQLSTDLDNIIADMPSTVTIATVDYTCTKTKLKREFDYTSFGLDDDYEFSIIMNSSVLSSIPDTHSLVTISSVEYRILRKEIDSAAQKVELFLGGKYAKLN